jgi:glycerol-3-phosphate acyltransferase PlsY
MTGTHAAILAASYLLGSVPFSYLVAKGWGVADVRKVGSGNVGATNVMRAAGRTAGLVALLLDAGKGAAASLVAERLTAEPLWTALAGSTAVLGHMYPVWLRFVGGKGVATGAGAFLPIAPAATGIALVVFVVGLAAVRYVSVASIAASVALAGAAFLLRAPAPVGWAAAATAALIAWKHRGNLARLAAGTERRFGAAKP